MKASIFTSAFCLFSSLVTSLAVPVAEPEVATIEARGVAATIYPSLFVPIFEDNPNIAFGSYYYAEVERSNGAHNVQTLIAYNFTTGYSGQTCTFSFSNARGASGSQKVQLFTVQGQITTSATFSYRPSRGDYIGTFNAVVNGVGSFDGGAPTFPCPTSPTTLNYEAVPEGDNDYVSWWINTGGLVIEVLN